MNTLGVIGSGAIGSGVARLAVAAGIDVVLSNSRGPQTLTDLVADLGERARAGTVAEAAAAGDAVLLAIPLKAVLTLPPDLLAGKLVLDTSNYYPGRDGQIAELDSDELTTSQLVQRHLVGARVVKAFNSIGANQLTTRGRPAGDADRSALPIAGDDDAAKREATELLDRLGFDAVDTGGTADSWRSEPNTPVYVMPYLGSLPENASGQEIAAFFANSPGAPVPADRVRDLIATAVRGKAGGEWPSD
jgi:predicted dinucleotide-binding enzyme